jgi:hypothetical protein
MSGKIFHDFNFDMMWDYWGHTNDRPRPEEGWNLPGQRPIPTHFHARAVNGWIKVEKEALT